MELANIPGPLWLQLNENMLIGCVRLKLAIGTDINVDTDDLLNCAAKTLMASDTTPVIGQQITLDAALATGSPEATAYQWQRRFDGEWREVGPDSATKQVKFGSGGGCTYRAAITVASGQIACSEPITLRWRTTSVDVTSSEYNPTAPELITLTANVTTAGEASPSAYQWQMQWPGIRWANVGGDRENLVMTHSGGGVQEYRVKVTMSDGEQVTSDPVAIAWRDP